VRVEPRLGTLRERLQEVCGETFRVTGSGSTLFALSSDEATARDLAAKARAVDEETVCLAVPFEPG
jgi:4-diphosphocytidyl-2C-methyl-D-erythritol kinase